MKLLCDTCKNLNKDGAVIFYFACVHCRKLDIVTDKADWEDDTIIDTIKNQ
jgi:hypothetical protein